MERTKIISRKKRRGVYKQVEEEHEGDTRRQFVSRRTSPFCSLRRLSTTRGKLFVRVSRGGSRGVAEAACTDGHAQRRDAFIDQRPYARQRPFYFSADGYVKIQPRPCYRSKPCEGEEERADRDANVPSFSRSSLHVFSMRWKSIVWWKQTKLKIVNYISTVAYENIWMLFFFKWNLFFFLLKCHYKEVKSILKVLCCWIFLLNYNIQNLEVHHSVARNS